MVRCFDMPLKFIPLYFFLQKNPPTKSVFSFCLLNKPLKVKTTNVQAWQPAWPGSVPYAYSSVLALKHLLAGSTFEKMWRACCNNPLSWEACDFGVEDTKIRVCLFCSCVCVFPSYFPARFLLCQSVTAMEQPGFAQPSISRLPWLNIFTHKL